MIQLYHWRLNPELAIDSAAATDALFKMGFKPKVDGVHELVAKRIVQYVHVATFAHNNLDLVWEQSNSFDCNWFEVDRGEEMKIISQPERSSMVGDLLVLDTTSTPDGFLVASFGFDAIHGVEKFIK